MQQGIYDEIRDERDRQDKKWGGPSHDDNHSINDFIAFIAKHAGMASDSFAVTRRKQMIRVAALAVAAIQKIDRECEREMEKARTSQTG